MRSNMARTPEDVSQYQPNIQPTQTEMKKRKPPSPETRAKMSAAHTGKKMSPESRQRMSEARTGKPLSPAQIAQMSRLHEAQKGRQHSPETRAKIVAGAKFATTAIFRT